MEKGGGESNLSKLRKHTEVLYEISFPSEEKDIQAASVEPVGCFLAGSLRSYVVVRQENIYREN